MRTGGLGMVNRKVVETTLNMILTKDETNSIVNSQGTTRKKFHLSRYWKLSTWHLLIRDPTVEEDKSSISHTPPVEDI